MAASTEEPKVPCICEWHIVNHSTHYLSMSRTFSWNENYVMKLGALMNGYGGQRTVVVVDVEKSQADRLDVLMRMTTGSFQSRTTNGRTLRANYDKLIVKSHLAPCDIWRGEALSQVMGTFNVLRR